MREGLRVDPPPPTCLIVSPTQNQHHHHPSKPCLATLATPWLDAQACIGRAGHARMACWDAIWVRYPIAQPQVLRTRSGVKKQSAAAPLLLSHTLTRRTTTSTSTQRASRHRLAAVRVGSLSRGLCPRISPAPPSSSSNGHEETRRRGALTSLSLTHRPTHTKKDRHKKRPYTNEMTGLPAPAQMDPAAMLLQVRRKTKRKGGGRKGEAGIRSPMYHGTTHFIYRTHIHTQTQNALRVFYGGQGYSREDFKQAEA